MLSCSAAILWCCQAKRILPLLIDSSTLDNFDNPLKHETANCKIGRTLRWSDILPMFCFCCVQGGRIVAVKAIQNERILWSFDILKSHKFSQRFEFDSLQGRGGRAGGEGYNCIWIYEDLYSSRTNTFWFLYVLLILEVCGHFNG